MNRIGSVVAVYGDHNSAEAAVKKLIASGFETKGLSVVGKGTIPTKRSSASTTQATE
jgi:hypothetical protein